MTTIWPLQPIDATKTNQQRVDRLSNATNNITVLIWSGRVASKRPTSLPLSVGRSVGRRSICPARSAGRASGRWSDGGVTWRAPRPPRRRARVVIAPPPPCTEISEAAEPAGNKQRHERRSYLRDRACLVRTHRRLQLRHHSSSSSSSLLHVSTRHGTTAETRHE